MRCPFACVFLFISTGFFHFGKDLSWGSVGCGVVRGWFLERCRSLLFCGMDLAVLLWERGVKSVY